MRYNKEISINTDTKPMLNKQLQRTVNKYFGNLQEVPANFMSFLNEVNHFYEACENQPAVLNITTGNAISEELLRNSEANLRTIFNNTDVSYLMLDREFRVISFNQRAVLGYKKELSVYLSVGLCLLDYFTEERKSVFVVRYKTVLEGKKLTYETNFAQPDGSVNWYDMNAFPIADTEGKILGLVIATEDITGRKNTELEKEKMTADLTQRNKDLEQFSYIVSHNLRSPVANIVGLSNLINNVPSMKKADQKKCMDGLMLSVKKLDTVIIDLNYILQVRREINEKKELVSFSELTKDIKMSINNLIKKENVTVKTNFIHANKYFTIKSYMNSIFYNLILNSIKYRSPDRQSVIEVKSHKQNGKLVLSFKDNGLGIDLEANGDKIFGMYKKFHTQIEGKGMGLYMVKEQVEMLGGKISVKSEVNQGTEFLIEFNAPAE